MKMKSKSLIIFFLLTFLFSASAIAMPDAREINAALNDTAAYIHKTVKNPQVGSVGGEWAVLGLARSSYNVPSSYYENYYKTVETYVKGLKGNLHDKKYTEYSRLILALTAAGYDPTKVAGYDLTKALGDFDKTIWQGINGPVFALIALDSGNYTIPKNSAANLQATRSMYIDEILRRQLSDGGFSLFGGSGDATSGDYKADPDITAMTLQALAKYQDRADVKKVTEEALAALSKMQNDKGGFASWGEDNLESTAQVVVALAELGIPFDDSRFVKNGKTALDNLLSFYTKGQGFRHTLSGTGNNQMSAEQGFYALVAVQRANEGKNSLYRMTDTKKTTETKVPEVVKEEKGLPGKHKDIQIKAVIYPGKSFADIIGHQAESSIKTLAERGIIGGKSESSFDPNASMTRAEFASIIVRALGLPEKGQHNFKDVASDSWYNQAVATAYNYGLVAGVAPGSFNPQGTITREEAAVMTVRAAKLAGLATETDDVTVRDILAQFPDYMSSSDWARPSLAYSYMENILSEDDLYMRPKEAVKRFEVAQMLLNTLKAAKLI